MHIFAILFMILLWWYWLGHRIFIGPHLQKRVSHFLCNVNCLKQVKQPVMLCLLFSGFYCDGTGLVTESGLCGAGFYCPEGQTTATPTDYACPNGSYCPVGSAQPTPCEPGGVLYLFIVNTFFKVKPLVSFQPVLHDWCNKGHGMCYPVCGMVHIKDPLLLIDKSSLCDGSGFPFSLLEWSLTICLTPFNRR